MAQALPMSLIQFQKEFGTEENCAQYLMYKRWKDGFVCPRCKHKEYYYIKTRQLFECQSCHYRASLRHRHLTHLITMSLRVHRSPRIRASSGLAAGTLAFG